jgi:hypothetical protein
MSTGTISVFPNDSLVSIQISGAFYTRLTQLILEMSSSKTKKEMSEILDMLKNNQDPTDPFTYHYITVLTLIHEIETRGKEQGAFKEVDETTLNQTPDEDSK